MSTARASPQEAINAHHYWLHGYINNLQYYFKFIINGDHCNLLSTKVLPGDLLIHIERVCRSTPPP